MLASILLIAQLSPPAMAARQAVARPCSAQPELCRISPFFCSGAYPAGLEPCWPTDTRQPRAIVSRQQPATPRAATSESRSNRFSNRSGDPEGAPAVKKGFEGYLRSILPLR